MIWLSLLLIGASITSYERTARPIVCIRTCFCKLYLKQTLYSQNREQTLEIIAEESISNLIYSRWTVHGRHRLGKVRLNNVNVAKEEGEEDDERKTMLHQLPNIERPSEETRLITDDILAALGDQHSQPFYALVAAKIPESVIRQKLSKIKQGKTRSPAKVFTSAMKAYATAVLQKQKVSSLMSVRKDLFRI
jgi:hypothetical protein